MKIRLEMIATVQQDPWSPYEAKGKGKGKGVVPEASGYGFIFVIIAVLVVLARVDRRRQNARRGPSRSI